MKSMTEGAETACGENLSFAKSSQKNNLAETAGKIERGKQVHLFSGGDTHAAERPGSPDIPVEFLFGDTGRCAC